jgi:hypothetical protein
MHGPFLTSLGKAAPESLQVLLEGCVDLLAGGQATLDVTVLPLRGFLSIRGRESEVNADDRSSLVLDEI